MKIGNHDRFRKAREGISLSPDQAAEQMGISTPALWDIETIEDELVIYSGNQIRRFCQVLCLSAAELFEIQTQAEPINVKILAELIRKHCDTRKITVGQFEDASGWRVAKSLEDPDTFLNEDYSIEGIQHICGELGVDWQRFILSL